MAQSSTSDHRPIETKEILKGKIFHNFKEVVPMFLYLWLLFALFTYHEAIVLARRDISYAPFGLAFVNAFVLAKVMLVAEKLRIGTRFRRKAPVFPIFHKSFLFALVFICFNLAEEIVIGLWKGKAIAESIPRIGGGSPAGIVIAALIMTVALIPFFAFREVSRVLGKGAAAALFLKPQPSAGIPEK
ncbi:MAG: hypothetical protein DMF15_11275 [Verrucomicrobia bacterium]|jgi:hypothetical protein|nr:MAG: hypothetical protein DMF15_11275 [Verrucomicrobiota bacterium]